MKQHAQELAVARVASRRARTTTEVKLIGALQSKVARQRFGHVEVQLRRMRLGRRSSCGLGVIAGEETIERLARICPKMIEQRAKIDSRCLRRRGEVRAALK